jgi:two-component system phosphate regulon sensor histidine kinase PhoR
MDRGEILSNNYGALLSALAIPALVIGATSRIQLVNPAAQVLFGPALEGLQAAVFLRTPAFLDALDATLRTGGARDVRLTLPERGAGTGENVLLVHLASLPDLGGLPGALVTFADLTALEATEAMRRDFVANVSHELRTPLTALMGFIETLRGAAKDDPMARDRFLSIMEREAARMIRLVSDLMSLTRVEAEERRRPDEDVDLAALLKQVKATLRPRAQTDGVDLVLAGCDRVATVPGDHDQLVQVFHNLVENAVRYAASGKEVRLELTWLDREPMLRGPAWRVDVVDKGEGIDPVHLPRLTERFYRVDAHRSREQGGTGLGLAIVKHIVSRHRGRFKIDSTPGKGSKFSVILPVE